jgi:hypothetical protein
MDNFYVYHLINSHNNLPFYIGKGIKNRLYHHEKMVRNNKIPNNNKLLFYKIKKIIDLNGHIIYKKIKENISEYSALLLEIEGMSGFKHKIQSKKIISDALLKKYKDEKFIKKYWDGREKVNWNEVRKKQSITLKEKFKNDINFLENHRIRIKMSNSSEKVKKKHSISRLNFYNKNPNHKKILSKIQKKLWEDGKYNNSKTWKFINPNGEVIEFNNLQEFCKKNNLQQSNMVAVNQGKRIQHKGWKKYIQ